MKASCAAACCDTEPGYPQGNSHGIFAQPGSARPAKSGSPARKMVVKREAIGTSRHDYPATHLKNAKQYQMSFPARTISNFSPPPSLERIRQLNLEPIPKEVLTDSVSNGNASTPAANTATWPENIDKAFHEGYLAFCDCDLKQANNSKDELHVGKNELISRYIYTATGAVRTKKQVSSHAQVKYKRSKLREHASRPTKATAVVSQTTTDERPKLSIKLKTSVVQDWPSTPTPSTQTTPDQQFASPVIFPDQLIPKVNALFPVTSKQIHPRDIFSFDLPADCFNAPPLTGGSVDSSPRAPLSTISRIKTPVPLALFTSKYMFSLASDSKARIAHVSIPLEVNPETGKHEYRFLSAFQISEPDCFDIITTVVSFGQVILRYGQKYESTHDEASDMHIIIAENACLDMFINYFAEDVQNNGSATLRDTLIKNLSICQTLLQGNGTSDQKHQQKPHLELITMLEPLLEHC